MEKPNNKGINLSATAIHALLLFFEQLSKMVLVKKLKPFPWNIPTIFSTLICKTFVSDIFVTM